MTSSIAHYGISRQRKPGDSPDSHIEDLSVRGYTVLERVLDEDILIGLRGALDAALEHQTSEWGGRAALEAIGEADLVRAPLALDDRFLDVAMTGQVIALVTRLLGEYHILSQQNGILNRPSETHHQSAFHRDLPHQHFVASRPLAISALFCLDPFLPETGSTLVLPGSHLFEEFPSDTYVAANQVPITASAGSVLVMDAMTYHRAGANRSAGVRRGLNHLYTIPIIKQQISLPSLLHSRWSDDPRIARFLGYDCEPPTSVTAFRAARSMRSTPAYGAKPAL